MSDANTSGDAQLTPAALGNTRDFFSLPKNLEVIRHTRIKIQEFQKFINDSENNKRKFVLDSLRTFLMSLNSSPTVYDEYCGFNIEHVGERFISRLESLSISAESDEEELFTICYRFLIELQLSSSHELSRDLLQIVYSVHEFNWEGRSALQIKYAEHQMIVGVMKRYIHHPDMVVLKEFSGLISKIQIEREAQEEQLGVREARIDALKNKLERFETAYNFVALYDGFKMLKEQKRVESLIGLGWMSVLGMVMITPLLAKIYISINPLVGVIFDIYAYASVVGLELILLFLFRVALHGYRAVKAQLIQIDLRMALCQFIQGYAEYASEVRKGDPQLLDRFDQLIFSGIVNNEGAIPSTFDGLDKIASMFSKLKDGKP